MKLPNHIEDWADERDIGHGVIVTLQWGYSFEHNTHEGVKGFDTVAEAKSETRKKELYPCDCNLCRDTPPGKR